MPKISRFLSTLSLRRATEKVNNMLTLIQISIHALLAESDICTSANIASNLKFLSTLSLRRATCYSLRYSAQSWHFYPRSPCGERLALLTAGGTTILISIHALLAESDKCCFVILLAVLLFLSTLSLRRATVTAISIRENNENFYPRSPCGERPRKTPQNWRKPHISIHALLAESDSK